MSMPAHRKSHLKRIAAAFLAAFTAVAMTAVLAAEPDSLATVATDARAPGSADSLNLRFESILGHSGNEHGEFRRPLAVSESPSGVLVVDTGNSRVQSLDANGEYLWEAGGLGTAEGSLRRPTSAVASGLAVYVLDALGLRIHQFHIRGEYQGVALDFRRPDLEDRLGRVDPRGLAVGRSGSILVTDSEGDRLLVFAPDWALLHVIGGFGSGPQSFSDPEGIATDRERILVADSGNERIQVLDFMGRFIASWPVPGGGRPMSVAVDARGVIYVADAGRHRVLALGRSGQLLGSVGAEGRGPGSLRGPSGVCVIGDRLIVADSENDRLARFIIERAGGSSP